MPRFDETLLFISFISSLSLSLLFLYVLSLLTFLFITSLFEKMKERTTAKKSMFGKDFKRERIEKKRERKREREDVLSVVERKKGSFISLHE